MTLQQLIFSDYGSSLVMGISLVVVVEFLVVLLILFRFYRLKKIDENFEKKDDLLFWNLHLTGFGIKLLVVFLFGAWFMAVYSNEVLPLCESLSQGLEQSLTENLKGWQCDKKRLLQGFVLAIGVFITLSVSLSALEFMVAKRLSKAGGQQG